MRAACRRASCAERAGSAGGPKPGRDSFYGELAGASLAKPTRNNVKCLHQANQHELEFPA